MATIIVAAGQTLSGSFLITSGVATSQNLVGAAIKVNAGGTVENLTVTSGMTVNVSSGATTSNLLLISGGAEVVSSGGSVISTEIGSGGSLTGPGTANVTGLVVDSGGFYDLTSGNQTNVVTVFSGAKIEFAQLSTAGDISTFSGNTLTMSSTGPSRAQSILLNASSTLTFYNPAAGKEGVIITCYAGGTEILTGHGTVPVEAISPGDAVVVRRDGQDLLEPVVWVGSSSIDLSRHARPELAAPIRVKAGALSDNTPARDLLLSPEHGLILDGRCVPVKLLVNGGSIAREYPAVPFEYYHVELEKHGILIAEGAEAESYLDTGNRSLFDNADDPRMLHPGFELNAEAERWQTDACAPLMSEAAEVAPLWQALADRSAALGFVAPEPVTIEDPDLHILVDGQRIRPVSDRDSRYVFAVPAGAKSVSLTSRFFIPADKMIAAERDLRRLGVRVDWIAIRSTNNETILTADHPALQAGWYDTEQAGAAMWRWTDGAATIPWENIQGPAVLTVRCTPAASYLIQEGAARLVA
jgi:autotransporter passenger strand-loop-strand repeat protein